MQLDIGVTYPGDMDPPEGYRKAAWEEVKRGEEVYLACLDVLERGLVCKAQGPYRVLERYLLEDEGGGRLTELGQRLLVRLSTTPGPPPP